MPNSLHVFADPADVSHQITVLDADGYGSEARRAISLLAQKFDDLSLVDEGRLGLLNSRNHARRVRDTGGARLVLKLTTVVVGNEVGALLAWQRAGFAGTLTPGVRAWGETSDGYQWILQEMLPGRTGGVADGEGMERHVIELVQRISVANATLPDVLELTERRLHRWQHASPPRIARLADRIACRLRDTSWPSAVLLHGDLGANNLLVDRQTIRVIDPAGLSGPQVFDVARFLSRSTSRTAVAPRVGELAAAYGVSVELLAIPAAYELLDVAEWSTRHDITGRGTSALLDDVEALLQQTL